MTRARAARLLGGFLGLTYIVLGLVESTIAIRGSAPSRIDELDDQESSKRACLG